MKNLGNKIKWNKIRIGPHAGFAILFFFFAILACLNFSSYSTQTARAAAGDYTLLEPLPCIPNSGQNCSKGETIKTVNVEQYVSYVFNFSMAAAVLLAVIMIFWGGFEYVTSEIPGIKSSGRERIQNAILGLIMVLISYLILNTIDPRLTKIELGLPKIVDLQTYNPYDLENLAERTALENLARYAEETRHDAEAKIKKSDELFSKAAELDKQAQETSDTEYRETLKEEAKAARDEAVQYRIQATDKYIEGTKTIYVGNLDKALEVERQYTATDITEIKRQRLRLATSYDSHITLLDQYGQADLVAKIRQDKAFELAKADDKIFTELALQAAKYSDATLLQQKFAGDNSQYYSLLPPLTNDLYDYRSTGTAAPLKVLSGSRLALAAANNLEKFSSDLNNLSPENRKIIMDERKAQADKIRAAVNGK